MTRFVARYEIAVSARADAIGALLGDLAAWPLLFQRIERVEPLLERPSELLARIWAHGPSGLSDLTCRCTRPPGAQGLLLRAVVTRPPLSDLGVRWEAAPTGPAESLVAVTYEFRVIGDAPTTALRVERELARLSDWDLNSVKELAELDGVAGD